MQNERLGINRSQRNVGMIDSMKHNSSQIQSRPLKIGKYYAKDLLTAFLFLLPVFVVFGVFKYYPLIDNALISLTSWDFFNPKRFVGLDNYVKLFQSKIFWNVMGNTIYYTIWSTFLSLLLGLVLALMLTKHNGLAGRALKTMFFIPNITTASAVAILWIWIFNPSNGLMEMIFTLFGAKSPDWLLDVRYARWAIISLGVWRSMGYCMMIFSSGISQINGDIYEAAEIDGASELRKALNITLPLLVPTILFLGTTTFITAMQVFDVVQVMTSGNNGTSVINLFIYQEAFVKSKAGRAAAASIILFFILLTCTIVQRKVTHGKEDAHV